MTKKKPKLSKEQVRARGRELAASEWKLPKRYRLQAALLALPPEKLKEKDPDMYALWERTKQEQAELAAKNALPHGRPSSQEIFRARSVQRAEETRAVIYDIDKRISRAITTGEGNLDELQETKRALKHKRAEYLSQHGRYDLAFEEEPDPQYREHYLSILDAIWREDGEHCGCPDIQGSGEHGNLSVPSFNAKEDIWSLKHGRMVTLMKCSKCGFMNAIDTPAHVKELRTHRAQAQRLVGTLTPEEAQRVLREKGHTTAQLLAKK